MRNPLGYYVTRKNLNNNLRIKGKEKQINYHAKTQKKNKIILVATERIIYDQLYKYLFKNNILFTHQSGFRAVQSTVTALLEAMDSWALNIDRGLINAVVFLDLEKAFDTVDHDILLLKLRSSSVRVGGGGGGFPFVSLLSRTPNTNLSNWLFWIHAQSS